MTGLTGWAVCLQCLADDGLATSEQQLILLSLDARARLEVYRLTVNVNVKVKLKPRSFPLLSFLDRVWNKVCQQHIAPMRKHRSSSRMMEESDYLEYEEPLFTFDNEQDEVAAMDQMHLHDDIDHEPLTPYGSAEAAAPAAVQASTNGSGRLHISSATAWQAPVHSSPPALSHSPSPRTPATFQYRQQDPRGPSRYVSRRNSIQYQQDRPDSQLSRHNLGQPAYPSLDASTRRRELPQPDNDDDDNDRYERPGQPREASPRYAPSPRHHDLEEPDLITLNSPPNPNPNPNPNPDQEQEYVMIPAEEVEAMFNGNEESRITAQKFKDQVVNATVQNGKVVYMVGQATLEWWMSPDMQRRRRAAGRKLLDVGGAVVSGAGSVIMSSTPLGRVCDSVSTNVSAFRAAPFSYTMQGLGIMKRAPTTVAALPPAATFDDDLDDDLMPSPSARRTTHEPVIADEDTLIEDWEDGDEFGGSMGMGMGMFDED